MESRRSARVATKLLAAIDGIDAEPIARAGDVSATGIYFETPHDVGPIGTIHWLRLASSDGRRLAVMAYVVRRVMLLRAEGPPLQGVAFEFMPETDEATAALDDFVRHVQRSASQAPPRQLSVRSMVLETNWRVEPGERVRIDIAAPGMEQRIRLEARAVRVAPQGATGRYTIAVEVQEESAAPLRKESLLAMQAVRPEPAPTAEEDAISDRLRELLSSLVQQPRARRHDHLSGTIARIRLPTLASLFELERMSGRLTVRRGHETATIFVREGRLVDVEPLGDGTARGRIAQILAWEDGAFELAVEPIDREDRVETSTTALLLEIALDADESRRA